MNIRFRAHTANVQLKETVVRFEALNALRKLGRLVRREYWKTTKTWTHKPKFFVKPSLRGMIAKVDIGTTDQIYIAVDLGTPAKAVTLRTSDKPKRALTIAGTYTAKTVPGVIGSKSGKSTGIIFRKSAKRWPGIKTRKFTEVIAANFMKSKEADIILEQAMDIIISKSGL